MLFAAAVEVFINLNCFCAKICNIDNMQLDENTPIYFC